jgi:UDP-N-acetylglucosamine 2-epimerase
MKLLTVIGARPQFIKAAAVGYAIDTARRTGTGIDSILLHTGQHYDAQMSKVFFEELQPQPPDHHLAVGSMSHGAQTGRMLEGIERVIETERPDVVLVYGDTNSTLAGALAAAKLHVPVAHVEAGLRSFNRRMPEELNRVVTDHLSEWLFCPTETAAANLRHEGISNGVSVVGDVMYELVVRFGATRGDRAAVHGEHGSYVLATIHRAENTDDPARLTAIITALNTIAEDHAVLLPLHPRTRKLLAEAQVQVSGRVRVLEPFGYLDMLRAQAGAAVVVTDSGGVQKEAFWLGVPCVTVRDETEWLETLVEERNVVCSPDSLLLTSAVRRQLARGRLEPPVVRDQSAGAAIVASLVSKFAH